MYIGPQWVSFESSQFVWRRGSHRTALFVLMFDQFFDSLNVSNYTNGKLQRKVFQDPYRSSEYFRIKVNNVIIRVFKLFLIICIVAWRNIHSLLGIELIKFYIIKKSITEQTLKSEIFKQISDSDDVLYYWDTLTEDQTQVIIIDELYDTIINEYVTVWGLYFASSIVESYKVLKKQNIQKSKGLRKTIPI